jgi:hypothetical protein
MADTRPDADDSCSQTDIEGNDYRLTRGMEAENLKITLPAYP